MAVYDAASLRRVLLVAHMSCGLDPWLPQLLEAVFPAAPDHERTHIEPYNRFRTRNAPTPPTLSPKPLSQNLPNPKSLNSPRTL